MPLIDNDDPRLVKTFLTVAVAVAANLLQHYYNSRSYCYYAANLDEI